MKSDIEVLDGAIALVEKDGGWCQGAFCVDKDGDPISFPDMATAAQPASFCLEGAIGWASGYMQAAAAVEWSRRYRNDDYPLLRKQFERLNDLVATPLPGTTSIQSPGRRPAYFNDLPTTTQEDAILALKVARAALEE